MRPQPRKVKALVVDDHPSFRATAREVVDSTPGFVFAGEAASGEQALEMIAASPQPDLVLMDVRMPGMGGIEAGRKIRRDFPHVEVVVLSQLRDSDRREVAAALQCVVVGKENLSSEFLRALWQKRAEIRIGDRLAFIWTHQSA
jgi:two-component system, NarL family, invasion response regulator UvrY